MAGTILPLNKAANNDRPDRIIYMHYAIFDEKEVLIEEVTRPLFKHPFPFLEGAKDNLLHPVNDIFAGAHIGTLLRADYLYNEETGSATILYLTYYHTKDRKLPVFLPPRRTFISKKGLFEYVVRRKDQLHVEEVPLKVPFGHVSVGREKEYTIIAQVLAADPADFNDIRYQRPTNIRVIWEIIGRPTAE